MRTTIALLAALAACAGKAEDTSIGTEPTDPGTTSDPDPQETGDTGAVDTEDTAPDTEDTDPDPPVPVARVLINEILATPLYGSVDDLGEPSGYVELYTDSSEAVALDGWTLGDVLTGDLHTLDGLVIPAGGHLVLWADGEPEQGLPHLGFAVAEAGAWLSLVDGDGVERDLVAHEALGIDVAASRIPDGDNHWQLAYAGTPGASNVAVSVEIVDLVPRGAVWRFDDSGQDLGADWIDPAYDDSAWGEGPAVLGYGNNAVDTPIGWGDDEDVKDLTAYFRHSLELSSPDELVRLGIETRFDDGLAVYVNGVEVGRLNMPARTATTSW
jgi:hypothetical protein